MCNHIFFESDTIKSAHNGIMGLCSKYVVSDRFIFGFV